MKREIVSPKFNSLINLYVFLNILEFNFQSYQSLKKKKLTFLNYLMIFVIKLVPGMKTYFYIYIYIFLIAQDTWPAKQINNNPEITT